MVGEETGNSAVFRVPAEYATVASALAAAAAVQGTVLVDGGTYRESGTLKVAAGVTLEGSGATSTVLECDATVLACADGAVKIANLAVLQSAEDMPEPCFGVELRGKTLLDSCRISARCRAKNACGVLARGAAAAPTVRGCTVHECGHAGVLLATGARLTLVQSEVRDCRGSGVFLLANCVLEAQGSTLSSCADGALVVAGRAAANLSGCELRANGGSQGIPSVSAKAGGRLVMRECEVHDGSGMGVQLADGAEANLTSTKLLRCAKAGLAAKGAGRILMTACEIAEGGAAGVMLLGAPTPAQPGGVPPPQVLRDNTIRANAKAGIQVSEGACPTIEANRLVGGKGAGIYVFGGARPTVVDNLIQSSAGPGIKVEGAAPRIERNSCCDGADVRARARTSHFERAIPRARSTYSRTVEPALLTPSCLLTPSLL